MDANAQKTFHDIFKLLDEYSWQDMALQFWAEAGTFLGCIREGGRFIGHDVDIDIGILMPEMTQEATDDLINYLIDNGFSVHHVFGTVGKGYEIAVKKYGVKVDLFFFYIHNDKLWHAAWRGRKMIRLEFKQSDILPTKLRQMEGEMIRTPGKAEEYLVARYGDGWRIPNPNWRWDTDPLCINWELSEISKEFILNTWKKA